MHLVGHQRWNVAREFILLHYIAIIYIFKKKRSDFTPQRGGKFRLAALLFNCLQHDC